MKNLIEELYFGNLDPNPCCNDKTDRVIKTINECEEKLELLLGKNEKQIFHEYMGAQSEMMGNASVEHFAKGFRIGAVLMMDILTGEKLAFE